MYSTCLAAEFFYIMTVDVLASFPGPTQLSVMQLSMPSPTPQYRVGGAEVGI